MVNPVNICNVDFLDMLTGIEIGSDYLNSDRFRMEIFQIFDFGSVRIGNALNFGFRKSDFIRKKCSVSERFKQIVLKLRIVESQPGRAKFCSFWTPNSIESRLGWHREFTLALKNIVRTFFEYVRVLRSVELQLCWHCKFALN